MTQRTFGATTSADAIAGEIEAVAREVDRIRALSRTEPHVFAEEKDAAARRLKKLAARVRNELGGAPGRIVAGVIPALPGQSRRSVRVEIRRAG